MSELLSSLEGMVGAALASEQHPTGEHVRGLIRDLCQAPLFQDITDQQAENLAQRLEERISITQQVGSILVERDHVPWLAAAKAQIDPYYWERYRQHLVHEGFPPAGVVTMDDITDQILGFMHNPSRVGPWDRRGMVVGHVQSGKTANYTGLICKAADAGYKLVVVIAGIHNNLRSQTQRRIDEGFVGRDSASLLSSSRTDKFVGVGRFDRNRRPITFTNTLRDFNKTTATGVGVRLQDLRVPAIFVIKKNSSTLRNLLEWLAEHSAIDGEGNIDTPMLLIDDEADNASINIRHGAGEVSRINGQIRQLLGMFDRSCYLGYTATPFANIFIDPNTDDDMRGEDLFPRSFIVSLDPPSNYFGPRTVFFDGEDYYLRNITDNEDILPLRHGIDTTLAGLPESMLEAVRTFILARAIRLARSQEREHCSMLVNASRFINVQQQIRDEIHAYVGRILSSIRVNGGHESSIALADPQINALHKTWKKEFGNTGIDWEEVRPKLLPAVAPIRVVAVNSQSSGALDYERHKEDGLNIIAVGGFSLSRGLTLEGLMVSYFLRNSMMYDTLMQMGRWFGYRPGYQDLCRIWMREEARGWYEHIADSIEELREEFRIMGVANATPEEFGLKVRSHPDALIVTARNKMGTGEPVVVRIGLASTLIETFALRRDGGSLEKNRQAALKLVERLNDCGFSIASAEEDDFGLLLRQVSVDPILLFLQEFRNHEASVVTNGEPVRRYIEERQGDELAQWDVLFASVGEREGIIRDMSLGREIRCQRRTMGANSDGRTLLVSNRQRVSSRGIERTGLSQLDQERVESEYRREAARQGGEQGDRREHYPDRIYRRVRRNPLLMVHLLQVTAPEGEEDPSGPVVAWGISFPPTNRQERRVEYVVNTTWLREHYGNDLEEEEMGGDAEG